MIGAVLTRKSQSHQATKKRFWIRRTAVGQGHSEVWFLQPSNGSSGSMIFPPVLAVPSKRPIVVLAASIQERPPRHTPPRPVPPSPFFFPALLLLGVLGAVRLSERPRIQLPTLPTLACTGFRARTSTSCRTPAPLCVEPRPRRGGVAVCNVNEAVARESEKEDELRGGEEDRDSLLRAACRALASVRGAGSTGGEAGAGGSGEGEGTLRRSRRAREEG
ncbi:hypothetical protein B0H14DRAFT_3166860, partial [Mycena olivaceomarginata]